MEIGFKTQSNRTYPSMNVLENNFIDMKAFKQKNGIPIKTTAEYDGFTGQKHIEFPTTPHLGKQNYPDVTKDFTEFKNQIIKYLDTTKKQKKVLAPIYIMKSFSKNLGTGDAWDTKFLEKFPGRDIKGKTQYGLYNGKVVSANYLSNNLYGQLMTKLGFPPKMSQFIAKMYSCGAVRFVTKGKLPHKELLKFKDPIEDQDAIMSGYHEFKKGNPWINKHIDPSRPHPKIDVESGVKVIKRLTPQII